MSETLATVLLCALKERGAARIFGIPGDFVLPFFRVMADSGILPLHTLSHEPSVGYAADAAARIGSSLGVAAVTYGAGALNMVNAVAQAYAEKSPLVVISGGPGADEGKLGFNLHHQVKTLSSQFEIFRELTCAQCILNDPETAPSEIARVLDTALSLSRPVYIEIPRDMVDIPCAAVPPMALPEPDRDAARTCARDVLDRLRAATSPAILVGVEARRYGLEGKIADLCQVLRLPVATSFMGRGLFAERKLPLVGTYLGSAGEDRIATAIEGADCLLMLGVIVCDTNFGVSGHTIDMRGCIRALDRTVVFGHHLYPEVSLEALIDAMAEIAEPVGDSKVQTQATYATVLPDDDTPLEPSHVAIAINDLFQVKGTMPIAADVGDCLFVGLEIADTALVAPGYYASMGMGVPAGLAINAVTGRRPIILVGDGAFQMTGWELGNCQTYGWAPIVIVFNNQGWEMLRGFLPGQTFHDLADWHYADIAPSLGGKGVRVHTCSELKRALDLAMGDDNSFQLIEVMLPRGRTSDSLQRFTQAIRNNLVLKDEC
ncbi:MAG: indolepyruvate/phenylpyruvate decarboxylase [Sphingomonadales bacterium BRH_c3]|nr:MAG: indolepyruvate/phenylpyruvate decarboxylase [Sphingomonadales bacterium BRH_c3]